MTGAPLRSPPMPLEEAQARLLALATPLPVQRLTVDDALGYHLATPLHARRTQPATDLSAMDGYAVAGDDTAGPWRVIGESAAGHPFGGSARPGEAVRVSTGAHMPQGSGCVILQEDILRQGDEISLSGDPPEPPGKHIRPRGMDFTEGAQVLEAGSRIGPAQLALALAAGHSQVLVHRPPRLLVMDSGDELAADPENCASHQTPASNGAMLAAMARALPCHVTRTGPVPDTMAALADAFAQGSEADVIVTSGGASVGDHDLVKPALEAWGATLDFWRVAIKPGKPLLVASREDGGRRQIVLGLPGNPVSSHVTAYLFMLPLLRRLLGATRPVPLPVPVTLAAPLPANGPRRGFLRAWWDGRAVAAHPVQDSGAMASLAASNVLIDRPAHAPPAVAGETVHAYWIDAASA